LRQQCFLRFCANVSFGSDDDRDDLRESNSGGGRGRGGSGAAQPRIEIPQPLEGGQVQSIRRSLHFREASADGKFGDDARERSPGRGGDADHRGPERGRTRIRQPFGFFVRRQVVSAEQEDGDVERRGSESDGWWREPRAKRDVTGATQKDWLSSPRRRWRESEPDGEVARRRGNLHGGTSGVVRHRESVREFSEDPETGGTGTAGEIDNPLVSARRDTEVYVLAFGKDTRVLPESVDHFVVRAGGRDGETVPHRTDVR
jgi:hypothetical protein